MSDCVLMVGATGTGVNAYVCVGVELCLGEGGDATGKWLELLARLDLKEWLTVDGDGTAAAVGGGG